MATSDLKTRKTDASVTDFVAAIDDDEQRADAKALVKLMKNVTGNQPKLWGPSMVGFGAYHYKYASGREGDWFLTGFSPRKGNLSIYIMAGFTGYDALMKKLGKHKTGKSCLYVKRLADIDLEVLERLVADSVAYMKKTYKTA